MHIEWQKAIDNCGLFWQYPVITEKEFYNQNKTFANFLPFPWATVLDKNVNINEVANYISQFISRDIEYYTCCQHIRFRELMPLFQALGVKKVYTPHKCLEEDSIGDIELVACPLYAVNFEDETKNSQFSKTDFINKDRNLLFSFIGGLQPGYLTDVRDKIFKLAKIDNAYVENTGGWHFNEIVYTEKQNNKKSYDASDNHKDNTEKYNSVLLNSKFSLCPSGTGPNSIRFWESLACGSIPVLLADTLELPEHNLWEKAIVRVEEKDCEKVHEILSSITEQEQADMRENCLKIYNDLKDNYAKEEKKTIVHYCCGTYYRGNFGGVACYDYQFSKAFPHRVFFEGPREREKMLEFLETCDNPIVVTDNHLSCDIPNKYNTFVVHHGVALTHAVREPTWDPYWRELCCSGQDRMFYHRFPETTKFISTSKFCTDEFTKHYKSDYEKFQRIDILHSSELDESNVKKDWNKTPVVLGNWSTENKGSKIVQAIPQISNAYKFQTINVRPTHGIKDFHKRKQEMYLQSDIFLQLSLCEGFSYAALDAIVVGLPVVSTDTGFFYGDIPEDCFVKIDWQRNNDLEHVLEKLEYAWENKERIVKNAREWYNDTCKFSLWEQEMKKCINGNF